MLHVAGRKTGSDCHNEGLFQKCIYGGWIDALLTDIANY